MTGADERWRVELGDCLAVLELMPDASIDACVCDPPYGLSAPPDMAEVLTRWLAGDDYTHRGAGFMSAMWDSFVPGPAVWREVLRVLKPGGHVIVAGSSRTFDLLCVALRLAGFEVRDTITHHYAQGWPKSRDIGKALNDAGAEQWEGWGTALKPATEFWCLARKPFRGTVEAQVLATGTGALNIDACRIASSDPNPSIARRNGSTAHLNREITTGWADLTSPERYAEDRAGEQLGRWPANLVLEHTPRCERVGAHVVHGDVRAGTDAVGDERSWARPPGPLPTGPLYGDELVEEWACEEGCPVALLNAQSGELSSGAPTAVGGAAGHNEQNAYMGDSRAEGTPITGYGDSGGAARFFFVAKPGPAERNAGLDADTRCSAGDPCPDCGGVIAGARRNVHPLADGQVDRPHALARAPRRAEERPGPRPVRGVGQHRLRRGAGGRPVRRDRAR